MRTFLLLAFTDAILLDRRGLASTGQGLDKVIGVLKKMLENFETQLGEDKDNWEKYSTWSSDEEADRNAFVQQQQGVVMTSTASLNANKQQVQTLTGQIADLTQEIAQTQTSLKELLHLRQEEHQSHEEEIADLSKTILAVNKAVEVLQGHYASGMSMEEVKQEVNMALSTLALSRSSDPKMQVVTKFLQDPNWLNTDGDSAYGAYTGVSKDGGSVIETLKSIRTTLMDNKQGSIEKEHESVRQYEVAKAAKDSDLKRSGDEKTDKEGAKDESEAKIKHFSAAISQANSDIDDAKSYVATLISDRAMFSKEFDSRSAMRSSEMTATQAAYDALQEVTAGAKSGVGSLIQRSTRSSGVRCHQCGAAVQKLEKLGSLYHDETLMQVGRSLAWRLQGSASGPQGYFDPDAMSPVKDLLHQLITKLEDELAAETTHHEWCETEKESAKAAKEEREKNIDDLNAEISSLTTTMASLGSEITFLGSELVRIAQETDTAVRIRKSENEAFIQAKADHDEVIAALDKAISALSQQYGFIQAKATHTRASRNGQSPFGAYAESGGGNALTMLQDLSDRYSKARTGLVEGEDKAKKAHEDLLERNEQFRKDTTQTKLAKTTEKRQKTERLGNAKIELASNKQELAQVIQYRADLAPSCDDVRVTFEERKKRREAEIAALKETLAVLDDPSMMR
jgi:hypothetical protein